MVCGGTTLPELTARSYRQAKTDIYFLAVIQLGADGLHLEVAFLY